MDLADYINEYNDVCPYKALDYKTPSKVFADYFTGMLVRCASQINGTINGPVAEAHVETAQEVSICTRIRNLRAYLDFSQAAFGEPLGLSPTHIARLEQGISEPSQSLTAFVKNSVSIPGILRNHRFPL